jgi:hypothetical protein
LTTLKSHSIYRIFNNRDRIIISAQTVTPFDNSGSGMAVVSMSIYAFED